MFFGKVAYKFGGNHICKSVICTCGICIKSFDVEIIVNTRTSAGAAAYCKVDSYGFILSSVNRLD